MFTVLTELDPTRYWLVCGTCGQRWQLLPESRLLPQTRRVFREHQTCLTTETEERVGDSVGL